MKLVNFRSLAALLCISFFTVGAMNADADDKSREPLTPVEENKIEEERLSHYPEELLQSNGYFSNREDFKDSQYLSLVHPNADHYVVGISDRGDLIQLNDESEWAIGLFSRGIVKEWKSDHPLYIKPKSTWFSSYNYVIQNRKTNQSIDANLISVPLFAVPNTFEIVALDPTLRLVQLNDATVWQINEADYAFKKWKVGDRLLVGVNNYWRMGAFVHILINTTYYNNPYCEANFLQ